MALLGLGLLAVSFCLFIYKIPPRRWIEYFKSSSEDTRVWDGRISEKNIASLDEKGEIQDEKHIPSTSILLDAQTEELDEEASTPKAKPVVTAGTIPLFNLQAAEKEELPVVREQPSIPRPRPTAPSMQPPASSIRSMAPPPSRPPTTSLMPPPSVRSASLRPLPKISGSLAPPPSAASSLRGPPRNPTSNLATPPSTSTLPPSKRPSRKVLLEPGHSPLDWANLIRSPPSATFLRGANVPASLIKVTPSQLKKQNGRKGMDAWGTYQGKVYNMTPYLKFHPGGEGELLRGAGKVGKAEELFVEIHPWVNWDGMLSECLVGILVSENSTTTALAPEEDLEAMD